MDLDKKFVAIKLHFGERGNLAYLRSNYVKVVADQITSQGGLPFATDCSTLYVGFRKNGIDHLETAALNGFNSISCGCPVITGDGLKGTDDVELPVPNGIKVRTAKIGRTICDADYMVTLTHFKGHMMTSFGGAIKNISMGCASRRGKMEMHVEEKPTVSDGCRGCRTCLKSCAEGAISMVGKKAVIDQDKCVGCGRCICDCRFDAISTVLSNGLAGVVDKMVEYTAAVCDAIPCFHISIVTDVSPGCDCDSRNDVPIIPNLGMFASFDPIALDKACLDACVAATPIAPDDMCVAEGNIFERVNPGTDSSEEFRHAERIGFGSPEYELVKVKRCRSGHGTS